MLGGNRKRFLYVHAIERLIICFVSISVTCDGSQCDTANKERLPRIGFCSETNVKENTVVIDGFNASNNTVMSCTCVARAKYGSATRIEYGNILTSTMHNCGSTIVFSQNLPEPRVQEHNCTVNGTMNIDVSQNIYITLTKNDPSSDTSYCLRITIDQGNEMNISCGRVMFWNNTSKSTEYQKTDQSTAYQTTDQLTSTEYQTTDQSMSIVYQTTDQSTSIVYQTTDQSTSIVYQTTDQSTSTEYQTTDQSTKYQTTDQSTVGIVTNVDGIHVEEHIEGFDTFYIGIGGGIIGMLLLTFSAICIVKKFRKRKTPPRADDGGQEDIDEYGLQYNTLYVSSDDVPNNHTEDSNASASRQDENMTNRVDGNYSKISLNDVRNDSVGDASAQFMNERNKYSINIDGDYAAIDMDENVASAIKIDIKSSKAENNVEEDRKYVTGDPDIKHVISPGENGCEYAIVQKDRNVDDQNNVYAVVDKTRKRSK